MRTIDVDETIINFGFEWDDIPPTREEFVRFLKKQPTVDAVPVVRCRECKWWQEDDDIGHCDNPDGLDNYAKPEDFCSYVERKEGAD